MKIKAILLTGALLAFAVSCWAAAADKPDFTGKWKMDAAKSDFGPVPGPDSQTNVIEHKDPKLKIATTAKGGPRGDLSYDRSYTTDGKESTNSQGGQEIKTVVSWDGSKLVFKSKADFQGEPIEINETYTLAEGGKSMTIDRAIKGSFGEIAQKVLFTKED
jgi:hypothetical protein